ncbi:MAG: STAS domain-containing protein [Deltaproteobacteria bacterium]|nr:STAS domain-containing protein [Deltaproteobacteria bacterium]
MPITIAAKPESNLVQITIEGRFDFTCHAEFRKAFASAPSGANFMLDLSGATYMDSAALGMLLLLRDKVGGDVNRVQITNAQGQPKDVLTVANFGQLFRLS